jgi:hypothetical protein
MNTPLKLFSLLVITFPFLTSCGDDEEVVDREPLIIGTWTLESQQISNATANGITVDVTKSPFKELVGDLAIIPDGSEITFDQNRSYTVRPPQQSSGFTGTWELSDDQTTITLAGLEGAEDLLGSSSLVFVILGISETDFNINTTSSEITIPNVPNFGTVNASGDYTLNLGK